MQNAKSLNVKMNLLCPLHCQYVHVQTHVYTNDDETKAGVEVYKNEKVM
jgi:hypothetical protein